MVPPTGWLPTRGTPIGVIMVKPITSILDVNKIIGETWERFNKMLNVQKSQKCWSRSDSIKMT